MTQLRKSTLINPSMVTTLKQKKVCIVWLVVCSLIIVEISCLFVGICICFSVVEFKVHRKTSHGSNSMWCRCFDWCILVERITTAFLFDLFFPFRLYVPVLSNTWQRELCKQSVSWLTSLCSLVTHNPF